MYEYHPKLIHAALSTFALVILIILGSFPKDERIVTALNIGAFIFAVITAVILALLIMEAANRRVEVMIDWMREFGKLDEEARAAVAFEFPSMRYRMKSGQVREFFENTEATIEHFRLFLETSTERQISPRRNWGTADQPGWAWDEIKNWLEAHGYILEDSYAGNHSWLWRGNAYRHLMAYWNPGRKLGNLNIGTEATYD